MRKYYHFDHPFQRAANQIRPFWWDPCLSVKSSPTPPIWSLTPTRHPIVDSSTCPSGQAPRPFKACTPTILPPDSRRPLFSPSLYSPPLVGPTLTHRRRLGLPSPIFNTRGQTSYTHRREWRNGYTWRCSDALLFYSFCLRAHPSVQIDPSISNGRDGMLALDLSDYSQDEIAIELAPHVQ